MGKPFLRENPEGQPEPQFEDKAAHGEASPEINLRPPEPQTQKFENLGELPAAPQKSESATEKRPPFKSVDQLVGELAKKRDEIEEKGKQSALDAATAKMVQDAILAAKKNQN